jgi:hypothetical protein
VPNPQHSSLLKEVSIRIINFIIKFIRKRVLKNQPFLIEQGMQFMMRMETRAIKRKDSVLMTLTIYPWGTLARRSPRPQ